LPLNVEQSRGEEGGGEDEGMVEEGVCAEGNGDRCRKEAAKERMRTKESSWV
jgi:hypothetical protein